MNFTLEKTELYAALQFCLKVISAKNTLPILDNFLIRGSGNTLSITSSDLENTVSYRMIVDDTVDGIDFCIDAKRFTAVMKEFNNSPISFTVNETTVSIKSSTGNYSFPLLPTSEFPINQMELDNLKSIIISPELLDLHFSRVLFAVSNDNLRPIMSGVNLRGTPSSIDFCATDATRLALSKYECDGANMDITIAKKTVLLIKNTCAICQKDIEILYDTKNIYIVAGNVIIAGRLIDGNYPAYHTIIPKSHSLSVNVDRETFLSAIKSVSTCSNSETRLVALSILDNLIKIISEDIDYSVSGEEVVGCEMIGDGIDIGFRSIFLSEILNSISSYNVNLELTDPSKACIIKDNNDNSFMYLLMPLMLNNV